MSEVKAGHAYSGSTSIKIVIPQAIAEALKIKVGDTVKWSIEAKESKLAGIVQKVTPEKHEFRSLREEMGEVKIEPLEFSEIKEKNLIRTVKFLCESHNILLNTTLQMFEHDEKSYALISNMNDPRVKEEYDASTAKLDELIHQYSEHRENYKRIIEKEKQKEVSD